MPSPPDTRSIAIAHMEVENSRYRSVGGVARSLDATPAFCASLAEVGQLAPVVLHRRQNGATHLLDGFARVAAARRLGWSSLDAVVLPVDRSPTALADVLLSARRMHIQASAAAQAAWVAFVVAEGVAPEHIVERYLEPVGLQPHRRRLDQCLRVAELPPSALRFGQLKRLSMGQLHNLARHPNELLELVLSWQERCNLSASVLDELVDGLADMQRQSGATGEALLAQPFVRTALDSPGSPAKVTARLREALRQKRFPILTEKNSSMEAIRARLALNPNVRVDWDRTLERFELAVGVRIESIEQWQASLRAMNAPEFTAVLSELFEEL